MSDYSVTSGLAPLLGWGWRKNRAVLLSAAAAAAVAAYVLYDDDESSEASGPPSAGSGAGAQGPCACRCSRPSLTTGSARSRGAPRFSPGAASCQRGRISRDGKVRDPCSAAGRAQAPPHSAGAPARFPPYGHALLRPRPRLPRLQVHSSPSKDSGACSVLSITPEPATADTAAGAAPAGASDVRVVYASNGEMERGPVAPDSAPDAGGRVGGPSRAAPASASQPSASERRPPRGSASSPEWGWFVDLSAPSAPPDAGADVVAGERSRPVLPPSIRTRPSGSRAQRPGPPPRTQFSQRGTAPEA